MNKIYDRGKNLTTIKKTILISLIMALLSEIHLYFLLPNFRVSVAIILFPVSLYYFNNLSTIFTASLTSIFVYITRLITSFFTNHFLSNLPLAYFPEIFFYVFYGVFYWVFNEKNERFEPGKMFRILILCDYLANVMEILIGQPDKVFNFHLHAGLLAVALLRSGASIIIISVIKFYKLLLLKEEHAERYRKLLVLSSQLKSEVFWMEKNMHHIEKTMTEAYKLFENINCDEKQDTWSQSALTIAKDIHEIKKEYALVVRGVMDITESKFKNEGMYLQDMLDILKKSINDDANIKSKNVSLYFSYDENFYTTKHYYLMSIFRNLMNNSIDALEEGKEGNSIYFKQRSEGDKLIFTIEDTGCGIEKEDIDCIFSPGYSTKINYDTGEINRGIGLSLVKEIIEEVLNGQVEVTSTINKGTKFCISLFKEVL